MRGREREREREREIERRRGEKDNLTEEEILMIPLLDLNVLDKNRRSHVFILV